MEAQSPLQHMEKKRTRGDTEINLRVELRGGKEKYKKFEKHTKRNGGDSQTRERYAYKISGG